MRSKNEVDYYVDDEYLWNIEDFVSVIIPLDRIEYHLKPAIGDEFRKREAGTK